MRLNNDWPTTGGRRKDIRDCESASSVTEGGIILLQSKKGTFYRKSFIWFLLTASIPGLITGAFIYWFSKAQIEQDLSELHQNQMEERIQNIDDQLSYLEMDLSHWAFNSRFGANLATMDFIYEFQETWDITRTLVILQGSHPLIKEVELYIEREPPIIFRTEYNELKDEGLVKQYNALLSDPRIVFWQRAEGQTETLWKDEQSYTVNDLMIIHKIPGESTSRFGLLAVTLHSEKLVNLLQTMTPYNEGFTFLLDAEGYVLAHDSGAEKDEVHSLLQSEIKSRRANNGAASGTFLWEWNDTTYSVSYGNLNRIETNWTYVSAAPVTAITSPVIKLSRIIIIVSLLVLLLGLALSWIASNWIYTPIRRLINKMSPIDTEQQRKLDEFQYLEHQWSQLSDQRVSLQERLNEQLPNVRNSFLLQLLQGYLYAYSERDLQARLQRYGWNTEQQRYVILRFQLTGYENLKGRFTTRDESLLTFAAVNIMQEIAANTFRQFAVLNFHDLSAVMVVSLPEQMDDKNSAASIGKSISQNINHLLGLYVTVTMSRPFTELQSAPGAFMDVVRFTGYRKLINQNQWIDIDDLSADMMLNEPSYPFALEMEILQKLRSGKQAETERCLSQFLAELLTRQDAEIYVQQAMLQLLGSIQHMILQSGISTFRLFRGANLFEELSQIRDPDNMLSWLKRRVIQPYLKELSDRAAQHLKEMVEQTVVYIHEHYMEDLSLDECANLAGTHSYTLSRLFKQITGVNFIEYVTSIRLEKAKELLRYSDKRIHEIAAEVGYQQRYFNRIFKKHVGVTPGQYRENSLKQIAISKNDPI